jgi:apolipoprotein N-acyltransferase
MANVVGSAWEMLAGRTTGPLTLRLIIQPTMAALLGIRAGLKDAKSGRTPYLWTLLKEHSLRKDLLLEGWKDVRKVALMAFLIDAVYQVIVFHWIYVLQAVGVAILLAIVPYMVVRALTTRAVGGERKS